ncbi:MAG: energy-coupling factor ABC transporter ATP-binding protein [Candidatus Methanomethyliaceae archaeon]|nr:energy-coupling factor ABC transporter ATP-binding protein [Candidatus Methanomethyliaceae archaeon]
MPIVEVRSLSYTYPGSVRPTLSDINISVEEGEFILLTGPSGCGKTTLCRCLNGLIPNSYGGEFTGKVIVDGLVTTEHPVYEIAQHVGLVFQNPENELFCTSVEREVAFGPENLALPREEIRKRVEESLAMVGISHLRDKSPEELSGGEQQKVAIAALLAMKPKILVLDEPTANLDPASAQSVLNTLLKLNEESGVTMILVEHRLEMVAHMADRCAILNEGRLVLVGEPEDVLYSDEAEAIGIGIPKVVQVAKNLGINKINGKRPLTSWSLADLLRM